MTGWIGFALALATFGATHFVPTRPALRARLVAGLGRRVWFSVYGLVSLASTAWVVWAAGQAPFVELWPQPPWTRWVPNLVMPVAIALAACGLPAATVTLGGPRESRLDPRRPGLAAVTRHPLLWALALWAGGHLPPNGDLAHVVLFGAFGAMALGAMPAFDDRARRAMPPEEAQAYFAATALLSPAPLLSPAWRRHSMGALLPRLALALGLWLAALLLHPVVIGASPLPL